MAPADPPEMEITMPGSNPRRIVLCVLSILLLLPLATAYAAPAKPAEHARLVQLSDLGRALLRSVDALLNVLRPATGWDIIVPPADGSPGGEGNGLDPHGAP